MLKVYMMMGLPGSGKTKRAKEMLAAHPNSMKRVSKDDLRAMMDDGKWSPDAEKFIIKARDALILAALDEGRHVIVDDTNLAPKHKAHIEQLIKGRAQLAVEDFIDVPIETCIEQDLKRFDSVGQKVIWRMYWQFLHKPTAAPAHDLSLVDCIICDIDGTLALHNGRGPYELEKLETDDINEAVAHALAWRQEQGEIIFVTGREEKYRAATERWLREKAKISSHAGLFMRQDGDVRRDDIVKQEIYEAHIKGKYNVTVVLDDRDRTVTYWRSEGLPCWQVNYGTF